jgi:hypothetical protein
MEIRRKHEKENHNLQIQEGRLARRLEKEMAELLRLQKGRKAKSSGPSRASLSVAGSTSQSLPQRTNDRSVFPSRKSWKKSLVSYIPSNFNNLHTLLDILETVVGSWMEPRPAYR